MPGSRQALHRSTPRERGERSRLRGHGCGRAVVRRALAMQVERCCRGGSLSGHHGDLAGPRVGVSGDLASSRCGGARRAAATLAASLSIALSRAEDPERDLGRRGSDGAGDQRRRGRSVFGRLHGESPYSRSHFKRGEAPPRVHPGRLAAARSRQPAPRPPSPRGLRHRPGVGFARPQSSGGSDSSAASAAADVLLYGLSRPARPLSGRGCSRPRQRSRSPHQPSQPPAPRGRWPQPRRRSRCGGRGVLVSLVSARIWWVDRSRGSRGKGGEADAGRRCARPRFLLRRWLTPVIRARILDFQETLVAARGCGS